MSLLFENIKDKNKEAADTLKQAGFCTDSEIRSLTREDLHELIPGVKNLKLRKEIFHIIHKQKSIDEIFKDLKGFIPDEFLRAALTSNGILVDYLKLLKDLKTQMSNVQNFLDGHINLLEDIKKTRPPQDPEKDYAGSLSSTTADPGQQHHGSQGDMHQQEAQAGTSGSSLLNLGLNLYNQEKRQVIYKMVVSGVTFDAHQQLLDKINGSFLKPDLVLVNQEQSQSNQDCQIIIVFCPIVSRVGIDVQAAMSEVTDKTKPVILVLMHHTHEVKYVASMRTWNDDFSNIVLHVSVFYHERIPGLLPCQENNDAISNIQSTLIKYSQEMSKGSSGTALTENKMFSFLSKMGK